MLSKLRSEVNQAPQFGALPCWFLASLLFIVLHKCYVPEETQFPRMPCSFLPLNLCTCCAPYLEHLCRPYSSLWPFKTQLCVSSPQLTSDASFSGLLPPWWHLLCYMLTILLCAMTFSHQAVHAMKAETESYAIWIPREPRPAPGTDQTLWCLLN